MKENHLFFLEKSYNKVGEKTWENIDFLESNLKISRNLFTKESLLARNAVPKKLEVFALLSGISFSNPFINKILSIQNAIGKILKNKLYYFVSPKNLGLEYCVFKWPEQEWDNAHSEIIIEKLFLMTFKFFC